MMKIIKPFAVAAIGLAIGIGTSSAVFAKAHDQGAADGIDPKVDTGLFSSEGFVAGVNTPGVGSEYPYYVDDGFLGVAADLDTDLLYQTYGQNVQDQLEDDARRVVPVVNGVRY